MEVKLTFDRTFEHFVRVLVEVDLTKTLRHKLLVGSNNFTVFFFVEMDYDSLPAFYTHGVMIGHDVESCYKLNTKKKKQTNTKNKCCAG